MAKPRYSSAQLLLGKGPDIWEYLGNVHPHLLVSPQILFRKVFKPKSPLDFSFYYQRVIVVRPWNTKHAEVRTGTYAFRVKDGFVTEIFEPGESVEVETSLGRIFYEVLELFHVDGEKI